MLRDIAKGIAKNTAVLLIQQIITWTSTFLLMLFLPRFLGPAEYGNLFLAMSVSQIFQTLVWYGIPNAISKEVSRDRTRTGQVLVDSMSLRGTFAVISLVGMSIVALLLGYSAHQTTLLLICGLILLWQAGGMSFYSCYQGQELIQYSSMGIITERVFVSIVGVAALLMGAGSTAIAVIMAIGALFSFLVLWGLSNRMLTSFPKVSWEGIHHQLKDGVPYFLSTVFGAIYYRISSVMLSKMTEEKVVGWFGGAFRLFETLTFLPLILGVAVFPVLARLWKDDEQIHRRTAQKSLELIILAGLPVSIATVWFSPDIIRLFFGLRDYSQSIIILQLLAGGLLLLYIDMTLGTTLLSSDKQKQQSIVALCAIPVNVGLNYVMIPYFQTTYQNGAIGSALATGITELCVMAALLSLLPKGIFTGFRTGALAKGFLAGLIMAGLLLLLQTIGLPWFIRALAGISVYVFALFALKTFEAVERDFIKEMLTLQKFKELARLIIPAK